MGCFFYYILKSLASQRGKITLFLIMAACLLRGKMGWGVFLHRNGCALVQKRVKLVLFGFICYLREVNNNSSVFYDG